MNRSHRRRERADSRHFRRARGRLRREPCAELRHMASECIGSPVQRSSERRGHSVDMAALVNGTTARYAELNDTYHVPGKSGVHPSDVILPCWQWGSIADLPDRSSTAVVAGYEVCLAMADASTGNGFDYTNFVALGVAVGSASLLNFRRRDTPVHLTVVVSGNAFCEAPRRRLALESAASGHAGVRGCSPRCWQLEGWGLRTMPFSGTYGWLDAVAGQPVEFVCPNPPARRILATIIKPRGACGAAIPSILAAEAVFRQGVESIDHRVVVETYRMPSARMRRGRTIGRRRRGRPPTTAFPTWSRRPCWMVRSDRPSTTKPTSARRCCATSGQGSGRGEPGLQRGV